METSEASGWRQRRNVKTEPNYDSGGDDEVSWSFRRCGVCFKTSHEVALRGCPYVTNCETKRKRACSFEACDDCISKLSNARCAGGCGAVYQNHCAIAVRQNTEEEPNVGRGQSPATQNVVVRDRPDYRRLLQEFQELQRQREMGIHQLRVAELQAYMLLGSEYLCERQEWDTEHAHVYAAKSILFLCPLINAIKEMNIEADEENQKKNKRILNLLKTGLRESMRMIDWEEHVALYCLGEVPMSEEINFAPNVPPIVLARSTRTFRMHPFFQYKDQNEETSRIGMMGRPYGKMIKPSHIYDARHGSLQTRKIKLFFCKGVIMAYQRFMGFILAKSGEFTYQSIVGRAVRVNLNETYNYLWSVELARVESNSLFWARDDCQNVRSGFSHLECAIRLYIYLFR